MCIRDSHDAAVVVLGAGAVVRVLGELALVHQRARLVVGLAHAVAQAVFERARVQHGLPVLRVQDALSAVAVLGKAALVALVAGRPVLHALAAVLVVFKPALVHEAAHAVTQGAGARAHAGLHVAHVDDRAVRRADVGLSLIHI